jgi:hypothetical protein
VSGGVGERWIVGMPPPELTGISIRRVGDDALLEAYVR